MFLRRVKLQLAVFAVLTLFGISTVAVNYLNLPQLLGFGQYHLTAEFTDASGLYPGGLVTLRGVQVGRISGLDLGKGEVARVDLAIDDNVRIPADLTAEAHSTSAAGENYVDLLPRRDGEPWLQAGSVLGTDRTKNLPSAGTMLDSLSSLANSLPRDKIRTVMREVTTAFNGSAADLRQLLDSAQLLLHDATANVGPTKELLNAVGPFMQTQQDNADAVRTFTTNLGSFTDQLRLSDADLRRVLEHGAPAADAVNGLVGEISPEIPMLLHDLASTGQTLKVYLPGLEQVLVLYPAVTAALQTAVSPVGGADPGTAHLALRPNVGDPPNCYDGFLPREQERDFTAVDVRSQIPSNLYCKVPHSDPRNVRGARNTPCLNAPGRRAASVEECLGGEPGTEPSPVLGGDSLLAKALGYDLSSGRVLSPDGKLYLLSGAGTNQGKEPGSWQQLLLK
ncbi:MCE family protein [Amycolatopsis silviterrae]|uniref:MCE family protein n=1 Tax=Amycolatopsis silviterrae TaxID=1656914 RepID=A0ABW5HJS3_9PSEU